MRTKLNQSHVLVLLFWGISGVQAQTGINSGGGEASGSGGSASYSIGQVVYTTNTGANGSVAQGVQQPYEISVVTTFVEAIGISLSVTVYPNPTIEYLTLEVKDLELSNLSFQLYDMNGKLLQENLLSKNEDQINMGAYPASVYFLNVLENNRTIKEFKVIKN
jgi:hypothetical protein